MPRLACCLAGLVNRLLHRITSEVDMSIKRSSQMGGIIIIAAMAIAVAVGSFGINRVRLGGPLYEEDKQSLESHGRHPAAARLHRRTVPAGHAHLGWPRIHVGTLAASESPAHGIQGAAPILDPAGSS
jgi:hypothetical protein